MNIEIWAHRKSGERYAVAVNRGGVVVAAIGPLHYSEEAEARRGEWTVNGDAELVDDINDDQDAYAPVEE